MQRTDEICYFQDSPATSVARLLRRRYAVRAVKPPETARGKIGEARGPAVWLLDPVADPAAGMRRLARRRPDLRLIAIESGHARSRAKGREWFASLPRNAPRASAERAVAAAFASMEMAERTRAAQEGLERAEREREELNRIGVALSAIRDVDALLEMILAKTREITGADAGSLYLVETMGCGRPGETERRLRFRLTQNDSREFPFSEYTLPIDDSSLAGYTAREGEVVAIENAYAVGADRPYRFNPRYDRETGYRTRSLLTVPMKNARGEVIGVVQLLNCKRDPAARLRSPEDLEREVQPFPAHAVRLAESLASQAAVAYENSRLYQDIESLFEGFVQAAVTAIEQRDPTTSGHSLRVSQMTVGLAEIVDRCEAGSYRATRFTHDQMKEIRYAALLHDFGKVGVREEVLVKAKKLYPTHLTVVESRFAYVRKDLEAQYERRKFQALLDRPRAEALAAIAEIEEEARQTLQALDNSFAAVLRANEPAVLPSGTFGRLLEIARQTYTDPRGVERPLLTPEEVRFLSIRRGSLDAEERQQIELHVVHSFNFLMQIPWTQEIRNIPEIARAHHEKLNGTGYPGRLKGQEIPLQARMMTICDIFDALSASDRPYKKAVPRERALAILEQSVEENELDAELFHLFLQARVFDLPHLSA